MHGSSVLAHCHRGLRTLGQHHINLASPNNHISGAWQPQSSGAMSGIPPSLAAVGAAAKPRVKATVRLQHMKFMQKAAAKTLAAAASQKVCTFYFNKPQPASALWRVLGQRWCGAVLALCIM